MFINYLFNKFSFIFVLRYDVSEKYSDQSDGAFIFWFSVDIKMINV